MEYAIAGVLIIPLVLGLVEFAKKFGIEGRWSTLLAVVLGAAFGGLAYAINKEMLPAEYVPWIELVVFSLSFGLGIPGLYDLGKRYFVRQ